MSEGEIKVFKITGQAANDYSGGSKKKRVTRKKGGEGEETPVIPLLNIKNEVKPVVPNPPMNDANAMKPVNMAPVAPSPATILREQAPPPPPPSVIQDGGEDKKIKVELRKKQQTKKVQLHPKKDEPQKVPVAKKNETRKKNRKVLLGVVSLHKRMTRAKKMHKKMKEMPLDKLKEELLKKKLIKPTSKAPESVLRQIATDAQIVESKAL